jgi:hypothetical protein
MQQTCNWSFTGLGDIIIKLLNPPPESGAYSKKRSPEEIVHRLGDVVDAQ